MIRTQPAILTLSLVVAAALAPATARAACTYTGDKAAFIMCLANLSAQNEADVATNAGDIGALFDLVCESAEPLKNDLDAGNQLGAVCGLHDLVFVTSATYDGAFGGRAAADAACQAAADAGGLSGTFSAWLSDSSSDAIDFVHANVRYERVDGVQIALDIADLIDLEIDNFINIDEFGVQVAGAPDNVWTGSYAYGTRHADNCQDWTSNDPADLGAPGQTNRTNNNWCNNPSVPCDGARHLYCFETGRR